MTPTYRRPLFLFSAHLETIYPALARNVSDVPYERERIPTADDDFLDLDWLRQGSRKLVIISHGLEGNSSRAYMKGMARTFYRNGFDVLAWNFRGCGEEMNKQLRFYHSGATDDLSWVIQHAMKREYTEIDLIGFSLGGNVTLKYLGEKNVPPIVKKAVTFSVPLDLHGSCLKISKRSNWVYSKRFLDNLKKKVIRKSEVMKGLNIEGIDNIKTLVEFDDRYTAPLHGFKDAIDYYTRCSSLHFLKHISIPVLIVNALNDPFLSPTCYPHEAVSGNRSLTLESPRYGGHVGFAQFNKNGLYWSEERALAFLTT
ncbi:MAG TPA: alpha/beta fold hydrolase [Chryseolinea sp.]|nr:alpha/beta fold hydrolase [Chryseolinea sp.]